MTLPMPNPSPTDRQLIDAIRDGNKDALECLYDRYSPMIYGLCHRLYGNKRRAEEAVIEVFVEVWDTAGHLMYNTDHLLDLLLFRAWCRAVDRVDDDVAADRSLRGRWIRWTAQFRPTPSALPG